MIVMAGGPRRALLPRAWRCPMVRFAALLVSSVLVAGCVAGPVAAPAKGPGAKASGAKTQASYCIDNPRACADMP